MLCGLRGFSIAVGRSEGRERVSLSKKDGEKKVLERASVFLWLKIERDDPIELHCGRERVVKQFMHR